LTIVDVSALQSSMQVLEASARMSFARERSLGSRKSGQRNHRLSHGVPGGDLPRR
jgi:hypothetical protein